MCLINIIAMTNSQPPVPPVPTVPPAQPVPQPPSKPEDGKIIPALATPIKTKAERLTYKQRFLRREKVKDLLDKGVTSPSRIAELVDVTDETVRKDIVAINKERKTSITREASAEHVSTLLYQLEDIIKNSNMDYMAVQGQDAKASTARSALLQTSLRAILAKAQLLMQTGVVPPDITQVDKLLEAQAIEVKARQAFDPQLAQVVASAESRRKVMDIVDKLKGISPDTASAILEKLEQKITEDEIRAPQAPVEPLSTPTITDVQPITPPQAQPPAKA